MAIRHLYTVLCDYLITHADGRTSAAGIFHNVEVRDFPAGKDPMGVVVAFAGDGGEPYEVALEGPGGFRQGMAEGTLEHPAELREHQQWAVVLAVTASPAIFPSPGVYRIVVRSGGVEIHAHPFGVLRRRTPDEEGGSDGDIAPR